MTLAIAGNASSGYNITKSLRFRSSASAYLSKTFATNGTSQTKNTFSFWTKRGVIGATGLLFEGYDGVSSNGGYIRFDSSNVLSYGFGGSGANIVSTSQVFRDPSAWYHIVIAVDTTQATASNRIRMYVNGSEITAFSATNYPAQNATVQIFNSGYQSRIGRSNFGGGDNFDGYLAEVNFIDGQQLTPSSFGSFNTTTGVWQPARYTGTYGTNGFYLPFTNTTSTTTLGYDFSGNGNNWTTNNISLTAGVNYDSMNDVPTLTSATVANYPVLNPLTTGLTSSATLNSANLAVACSISTDNRISGTFGATSGKWYWEATITGTTATYYAAFGVTKLATSLTTNAYYYESDAKKISIVNGSATTTSYGATYTTGDIIGVAFDADAGTLTFYKNNVSQGTAFTGITIDSAWAPWAYTNSANIAVNFGQQPFTYTPPTGFVALNTFNLPTSTIVKGNTVMDATTYTGNNATRSITNGGSFKPDFIWIKDRSRAGSNDLVDSVRGVNKALISDGNYAEYTGSFVTSFDSTGFSLPANTTADSFYTNINGDSFVAWQWQAGQGTTSSNTSGSITSTVSVNPTAGFSVVSYTGTGSAATVGHGLGVAPSMIIVKNRTTSQDWRVYTSATGQNNTLFLNATDVSTADSTAWNNTAPTSSVFSIGTSLAVNQSSSNFVAYCWAQITGFSQFGYYTGNGSSDGTFVYTGFRPKFVMMKSLSAVGSWIIQDTSRSTYNAADANLYPNLSNAEDGGRPMDLLSNGFKLRQGTYDGNKSSVNYIYAAFAENPFKNALAR